MDKLKDLHRHEIPILNLQQVFVKIQKQVQEIVGAEFELGDWHISVSAHIDDGSTQDDLWLNIRYKEFNLIGVIRPDDLTVNQDDLIISVMEDFQERYLKNVINNKFGKETS